MSEPGAADEPELDAVSEAAPAGPSAAQPERPAAPEVASPRPHGNPALVPEPAASEGADPALSMNGLVTVVPGIARYHRSECILIRFLGGDDLETMTRAAAEDASLVACRACQPDEALAGS